jgi:hypothetical protein
MAPINSRCLKEILNRLKTQQHFLSNQLVDTLGLLENSDDITSHLELFWLLQKDEENVRKRLNEVENHLAEALKREAAETQFFRLYELTNQNALAVLRVLELADPLFQESDENIHLWLTRLPPQISDRMWHLRRCYLEEVRMIIREMERFSY